MYRVWNMITRNFFNSKDSMVGRIVNSYFFWISVSGIIISVVISKL